MGYTLVAMSPREVLTAIHREKNALLNVEGPHGRHVDGNLSNVSHLRHQEL
jgi:hypothetical protein